MVNWIHFPKNKPLDKVSAQIVKAFEAVDATIDSYTHQLKSDEVLTAVRPGLEALGFDVEKSKKSDDLVAVPVLYGVNGKIEKAFEADGYLSTAGYVIEVEAGRAVVNYQFLKDFFEACTMVGVDKLCIAVRNKYRAFNDFDRVCKFFEAIVLVMIGRCCIPILSSLKRWGIERCRPLLIRTGFIWPIPCRNSKASLDMLRISESLSLVTGLFLITRDKPLIST